MHGVTSYRVACSAVLLLVLTVAVFAGPPIVTPHRLFTIGGPGTTNNDDSCDVGLFPAATLLLPYFEVDLVSPSGSGETTLFTITNTSNLPQVAYVTLWTDRSYPVLSFNIYLTGYDVQSLNLRDVIVGGRIAPEQGTGSGISPVGKLSGDPVTDEDHDNALVDEDSCHSLPVNLPAAYVARLQHAFTLGRILPIGPGNVCNNAGGVHANAVGYATVDVVDSCSTIVPTDDGYFRGTILFDNVLIGDYQQVNGAQDSAQGNPMVHIRAIPEGGSAAQRASGEERYQVNFNRTFYSRYQPEATKTFDARQPLPSTFAARWISGGDSELQTFYKIWRERQTAPDAACVTYPANGNMAIREMLRFDEDENPQVWVTGIVDPPLPIQWTLPASSLENVANTAIFPPPPGNQVAGWMYLNLDRLDSDGFGAQAWVTVSMRAERRYAVDSDAIALGNGCTPPIGQSESYAPGGPIIGPSPNMNP